MGKFWWCEHMDKVGAAFNLNPTLWEIPYKFCPICGVRCPEPTKAKRREKVEELSNVLLDTVYPTGISAERKCERLAEAALKWIEKQLPLNPYDGKHSFSALGYDRAIYDVRKNLGVE
jgi:hypothetical protein